MGINAVAAPISGAMLIRPDSFPDMRGVFLETYNKRVLAEAQVFFNVVQDNLIINQKGALRGIHYQNKHPQSKLIRVLNGSIFDVIIDLRENSGTYGKVYNVVLSGSDNLELFVPKGVAHGFLAMEDDTVVSYKTDDYYHPEDSCGIRWNDPYFGVQWPIAWNTSIGRHCLPDGTPVIVNERDQSWDLVKR